MVNLRVLLCKLLHRHPVFLSKLPGLLFRIGFKVKREIFGRQISLNPYGGILTICKLSLPPHMIQRTQAKSFSDPGDGGLRGNFLYRCHQVNPGSAPVPIAEIAVSIGGIDFTAWLPFWPNGKPIAVSLPLHRDLQGPANLLQGNRLYFGQIVKSLLFFLHTTISPMCPTWTHLPSSPSLMIQLKIISKILGPVDFPIMQLPKIVGQTSTVLLRQVIEILCAVVLGNDDRQISVV